jgi:hypothetical protein
MQLLLDSHPIGFPRVVLASEMKKKKHRNFGGLRLTACTEILG